MERQQDHAVVQALAIDDRNDSDDVPEQNQGEEFMWGGSIPLFFFFFSRSLMLYNFRWSAESQERPPGVVGASAHDAERQEA